MRKNKRITIRLTESQMKRLTDTFINEEQTQSQIIREMIDKYVRVCRKTNKSNVLHIINELKDINNENK